MMCARRIHPVPLALAALCSAMVSCYRPDVLDGGLRCGADGGGKRCPDGFACYPDGWCWRVGHDGGPTDVRDGPDAPEVPDAQPDTPDVPDSGICFQPKPNCDPPDAGGLCDPFCQTGCDGCRKKCSVNTLGALTCNEVVPGTLRTEFMPCTVNNRDSASQSDACGPGLVCIEDACTGVGSGSGRCYKFCNGDGDCPSSQCARSLPNGFRVCDVPNVDSCNPTTAQTGCPSSQGCYIAIARPTHTVCDCPGSTVANDPCDGSRSCFPGLLCVDPNGQGSICLKVCDLNLNGADCGAINSCRPYSGNTGGTMVHPRYGFCF